jgi:hypothetical protein
MERELYPLLRNGFRVLLIGLYAFMVGCGPSGPTRLKMKFDVSRKANADNPVRVDVVVAYDPDLVEELDRLTASEWFDQRESRVRNNPGGAQFSTWRWELTPGLEIGDIELKLPGELAQGVIFSDYISRGKHSARFDPRMAQTVQFRHDAFRVVAGSAVEPESMGWRPPVGWTLVTLGLIGAGLGSYFALTASSKASQANELFPKDRPLWEQLKGEVEDNQLGMWISYGVGASFLIAGTVILLWPEGDESPFRDVPNEDGASASVNPW